MAVTDGVPVIVAAVPKARLPDPRVSNPLVSFSWPFTVAGVLRLMPLALEISMIELVPVVTGPGPEIDCAIVPFSVTVPAEEGEKFKAPVAATRIFPWI